MLIGRWCMTIIVSKLWPSNRRDSILIRVFTVGYRMNVVLTFEYTAMNYCDLILCPTWVNMKNSITDQQNQSKYSIDPVQISFIWAYFVSFYTMAYFLTGFRKMTVTPNSLRLLHDKKFAKSLMDWTGTDLLDLNVNVGRLQWIFAFVKCWTHEVNTICTPDI